MIGQNSAIVFLLAKGKIFNNYSLIYDGKKKIKFAVCTWRKICLLKKNSEGSLF